MSFEARSLEVRYSRRGPPVLRDVDLRVPQGSLYAVLGPNGSGKSTLMRALLGTVRPVRGSVSFEGRRIERWSRRDLARAVGAVPQTESLAFPVTVRELVGMGRYPHIGQLGSEGPADREAVADALRRCDATDLSERDVGTLSGGELQRVRIARALAQRPRALALDEPTASLDVRHEMSILRLLRDSTKRGITVLLITHHLNMAARFADRILLLDEGKTAADGTVREVIRPEILESVYRWPVAVDRDPATGAPRVTPRP